MHVQVQAHMQAASQAAKPLVIDEFNSKRPIAQRNAFLNQIFALIDADGSPVVGEALLR